MRTFPSLRRVSTIFAAAALAITAGAAVAHEALTVRRVLPPAAAARARVGAAPMTAAEQREMTLRADRQRIALPIKRQAMGAGLQLDRSLDGYRRPNFRDDAWAREAAAAARASAARNATGEALPPPTVVRMAMLRVDFLEDRGGNQSTGTGRFDLSGPDSTLPPIDRAPHNKRFYDMHARALERYYDVMSYGRVKLIVDVWPAEQDSAYHLQDMADLGPWTFGQGAYIAAVQMFRKMFFAADSQSIAKGDRIPWETYDRFTIIHAGSDLQSDLKQDSKEDIPSFTVFLGDTDRVVFPDSAEWNRTNPIDRAAFIPETINQDGYYGAINGVLAHENGHNLFGFIDVYNVDNGYPMCGLWSLMDSGNLVGSRVLLADDTEIFAVGMLPPSVDPFQRAFIGDGMDIRVPVWGDTVAIERNQKHNVFYKLPFSSDEYVLLENRYLSPADTLLKLDSDSVSRVILGPELPDPYEYDALLPGGGILAWQVDESVVPFEWSLRTNPDYGLNSNYARQGLQVLEADGLDDLGDPGSPYILGSPLDPWQRSIAASLSDTTMPALVANTGTRPHLRVDFLDDADSTMHFSANRTWNLPAFPRDVSFPDGGPDLLAIDVDGDRDLEVCWAGGDPAGADSAAIFALEVHGGGVNSEDPVLARLDRRPLGMVAAALVGDPELATGPSLLAVTTRAVSAADTVGGRVWLLDRNGAARPGFPVKLPSHASTGPVFTGVYPNLMLYVGAEDGAVYAINLAGQIVAQSGMLLAGGVTGRLAVNGPVPGIIAPTHATGSGSGFSYDVAAGGADGSIGIFRFLDGQPGASTSSFVRQGVGGAGFAPDFLWIALGGAGEQRVSDCANGQPVLVVHDRDRLSAFCSSGEPLPGWGGSFGDTIVAGLGAGDPDGDGFPEVLVQTVHSQVAFVNRNGTPSPGWPRRSTSETIPTASAALALDVDGDGRSEIVVLNGSGMLVAMGTNGRAYKGWPLATGAGAAGSMLAADLDRDGHLDLVAPDRDTLLYGYSLPVPLADLVASSWTMPGGDPARTCALATVRTPVTSASSAGPLVAGSFKAFPNPARLKPVTFAFTLSEGATAEFRILDASGHEVASFSRRGERAENAVVWEPGALPAGLYVARVKFSGPRGSQVATVPVGLIR
ncbi:MAG: FG-GAP-like repeat-containing protein [Candidatus Eisenbacteria bacterium]